MINTIRWWWYKIVGKVRLRNGYCPQCNYDAPKLYDCPICKYGSVPGENLWARYKLYWKHKEGKANYE